MKRNLLLTLLTVFAGVAAFAQTTGSTLVPMVPASAEASELIDNKTDYFNSPARGGEEFFCEDFSNGFDGNNPFGAFTYEDNGIEDMWRVNTTESPISTGQYSTSATSFNSITADNGYVIMDMDGHNTDFELYPGAPSITGYLNFPNMDMSGLETVVVEWSSYFRYCCFPFSPLTLQVSTDGGDTWTLFEGHGNFTESANTYNSNGSIAKMDISCVAAGEESVDLRFGYNSELADIFVDFGFAYSTYFWALDDICIYANPVADDIEIEYVTNGDVFEVWEYLQTPMEQAITADDGGLLVGTVYRNNGSQDQEEVVITVEILADDETTVLNTTTSDPFTLVSNVNSDICPQQFQDTTYLATGFVPAESGFYFVRSTIAGSAEDETPDDNTFMKRIEYTTDAYGHADIDNLDVQIRPSETSTGSGEYNATGAGNFYHMPNEGTTGYGLLVNFGPASDEDVEFELRCYYYDNTVGITDSDYDETFYTLAQDWIPQGVQNVEVYLPFEDPIEMFQGEAYFVGVMNDFISELELSIRAQSNSDSDNSTGVYALTGGGDMNWFTSQTSSPAVRLITSERVGVDELALTNGILLEQNVPNPANNTTAINFNLTWSRDVVFEVHDLSGRIIQSVDMGTQAPGNHTLTLDVSDMSNGVYYYTMRADDISTTKKMVIASK